MPQKIFIGNIKDGSDSESLQALFEKYGEVAECDIVSNYAFVHMMNESDAQRAVEELHNSTFEGQMIRCELSTKGTQGRKRAREGMDVSDNGYGGSGGWRGGASGYGSSRGGRKGGPQKIFIGNVKDGSSPEALRALFEKYGEVKECDILSGFAFVHMTNQDEAKQAVEELHNSTFEGSLIRCELSTQYTQGRQRAREDGDFPQDNWRGGRGRGRGDRRGHPYHPYAAPNGDRHRPYPEYDDPYSSGARRRDILRDPYMRDPILDRDPLYSIRDPYRDALLRDLYAHDAYLRDNYIRDPVRESIREPFARDRNSFERDPYSRPPPEFYDQTGEDPLDGSSLLQDNGYSASSLGRGRGASGDLGSGRFENVDGGFGARGGAMRGRWGRGRAGFQGKSDSGNQRQTITGYTSFE